MLRLYVSRLVKRLFRPDPARTKRPVARFRPMLERLETRLTPSTVNWVGGSGDWSNANNWLDASTGTHHTPGASDDAVISQTGIIVTHSTGTDSVNSLTSSAAIVLSGGSLSLASASAISNTFTESGGGTLTGAGTLSVSGLLAWTGGTMSGTGVTNANGGLQLGAADSSGHSEILIGRTLNNAGSGSWLGSSGYFYQQTGSIFNNEAGATLSIQNDLNWLNSGSNAFNNAGTLQKTAGTGTTTIYAALNNSGSVSVQSGTLYLSGGLSQFSGTTLTGGTYFVSGTLEFTGANIQTNAANIVLDGAASQIVNQNGVNALANLASNTGSFTVQNGQTFSSATNFSNAGTLTAGNNGTFSQSGSYSQTGTLNVLAGGTVTLSGSFSNYDGVGTLTGGTYDLLGTLQFANAVVSTNAANLILDGSGAAITDLNGNDALGPNLALNVAAGHLTILDGYNFTAAGNFENDGILTVGSGSIFTVSGNFTQGSSSTLEIQLGGVGSGNFGQVVVNGTATFAGTLTATLVNGYVPTTGDTFPIVTYTSRSGDFTTGPTGFNRVYDDVDGILNLVAQ